MSQERTAASAARSVGSGAARGLRAWRALPYERRLAAGASLGLFVTLFLPWYQRHFFIVVGGKPQPASDSVTAWAAFSFVEAAVLLVAVGVLTLLFKRAEGKAFHLPGGDGWVIMLAGFWTSGLVIWRIFDKQGASGHGQVVTTSGIEWGILVALGVAGVLTYSGSRIRAAHQPEPPLPGEADGREAGVSSTPVAAASGFEPTAADSRSELPAADSRSQRAAAGTPEPARATPPRPVPARPPEFGSASDRRTGWLTARPEGWTENPDTARREPTRSWSFSDDYVEEPPLGPPPTPGPADKPASPESATGERVDPPDAAPPKAAPPDAADAAEPRTARITRRRKRPPDDQLTIKLDRDNDA